MQYVFKKIPLILIVFFLISPLIAKASCSGKLGELDRRLAADRNPNNNEQIIFESMRDQAASLCESGQDQLAGQMIDGLLQRLSPVDSAAAETQKLPKSKLATPYLEGVWCTSWDKSPERAQYLFAADGSFKIGMLAGSRYSYMVNKPNLKAFYQRFEKLKSMDDEMFVVVNEHDEEIRYQRGSCP